MFFSAIVRKVVRRLEKILYKPIEVFVFHAVSDSFDESVNERADWTQTDEFKNRILNLKSKYVFISLEEAYHKLNTIWCRWKHYAVLTCDDGFLSVVDILPFLEKEKISVTLFVNPKYLDGINKRDGYAKDPKYITREQLWQLNSQFISVGMHGYSHDDVTKLTEQEFNDSVEKCQMILQSHPRYCPFFAYTWGKYSCISQQILKKKGIIPVLTDGGSNYHYRNGISRKPIDSYYWKE